MPSDVPASVQAGSGRVGAMLRGPWRAIRSIHLPWRDPFAMVGILIYAVFLLIAIFADTLATHDPTEILFTEDYDLAADRRPGEDGYILGTTSLGRDLYSQLVYGSQSALLIGLTAACVVAVIGTLIGLMSGYFGGLVDTILMRLADIAFGIPFLPFVIVLAAFLEPSIWNVVLAMALILWRDTARVIRSQVLSLRTRAYVEAARVSGSGHLKIVFRHIAPNILPLSFLYGSIAIGWAILTEASISFLGFGDPETISWGYMLQDAYASQALSTGAYYWFIPPGVCIVLVVVAGFFHQPRLRRNPVPEAQRMTEPLLSVRDLSVSYVVGDGMIHAVDGASFQVPAGEVVGLVGESGCGKSTVARALTRVVPRNARFTGGDIRFDGRSLLDLSATEMNRLRWRDIAFIPQSAMNSLDPVFKIEAQLGEVLRQRGGLSRAEAREKSEALFELVGIEPRRLKDYPHQFSGGMRQRVAIALALALDPKLIIADEPVTALDVIVQSARSSTP